MSQDKISRQQNHARAPKCAAFVEKMRELFGADQVKVLRVSEGDFRTGEPAKSERVA